jgi:hypothetical protein
MAARGKAGQEASSFLKKRSKKLLSLWTRRSGRILATASKNKSRFASFSSEKEESLSRA